MDEITSVESVRHTGFAPVTTDFIAFDPLKNYISTINVIFSLALYYCFLLFIQIHHLSSNSTMQISVP